MAEALSCAVISQFITLPFIMDPKCSVNSAGGDKSVKSHLTKSTFMASSN